METSKLSALSTPHVLYLLPYAKEEVPACIKQGYDRVHSFGFAVEPVVPFDERHIAMIAYRPAAFTVAGQVFVQKEAVGLTANLEPHGVIVVLLDFGNLDIAHHLAVVHHGEAAGPAVVIHSRLGDAFWATDNRSRGLAVLAHFLVARVAECIAVLFHEGYLLFEFVGRPGVITVEKGDPPALCLAEGAITAVGGTAVAVVFEVVDFRREIPAFAGMTA